MDARPPGLIIAAPRSGSGKTLLTLGLMRGFRSAGLAVGGAKCGPDYIDPAFHAAATGNSSYNLDSWAMPPALIGALGQAAGEACDLILCEGLMGLFDGVPEAPGRTGSTADTAAALSWPVLLVIDVGGQSQTAAALVLGCASFDRRVKIAGVVLNRVASARHDRLVRQSIEALGIPVVGALPRMEKISLPERHLGLVQAREITDLDKRLDELADFVCQHVDKAAVKSLARPSKGTAGPMAAMPLPARRIAIARDDAFSFIYPHLLGSWRRAGAKVSFFSPLANEPPPEDSDFVWLPGGYPELHAKRLSEAGQFFDGLRRLARQRPVHGECGGYMVLGERIIDAAGETYPMARLLGVSFSFAKRKLQLGYREARLTVSHPLGEADAILRGHEFHYATIEKNDPNEQPFALVHDAHGEVQASGSRRGNVSGSFFHFIAGLS
ncbi:MAG TPA: cobyrinate a,c-diamide synthase [Methylocella sp.]|nr:cobyrinate a,c-diamide synthase [Methylocella sp.]